MHIHSECVTMTAHNRSYHLVMNDRVSVSDTAHVLTHSLSPAWSPPPAATPCQSQPLECCYDRPTEDSLASDLGDCQCTTQCIMCNRQTDMASVKWVDPQAITLSEQQETVRSYQIEWLWQKSRADMIWRKNLRASFGVRRPFLTR